MPYAIAPSIKLDQFTLFVAETDRSQLVMCATVLEMAMNLARYQSMPADLRAVIDRNSGLELSGTMGRSQGDTDVPTLQNIVDAGAEVNVIPADELDLSRFANRGGRMLLTQGTVDDSISPHNTIAHWQRLVATNGQSEVDPFKGFYRIPGYGTATPYSARTRDWLATLVAWVERGQGASARPPRAALPGGMRMNARLATKVVVRTTMPRSEAQQAPHFAAARRDGSLRASALSLGLPRHPALASPRFARTPAQRGAGAPARAKRRRRGCDRVAGEAPACAALVAQRDAAAGVSRNEPSRPCAGCAEAPQASRSLVAIDGHAAAGTAETNGRPRPLHLHDTYPSFTGPGNATQVQANDAANYTCTANRSPVRERPCRRAQTTV